MMIHLPSLMDHLADVIITARLEGHRVSSITLPVWCQQVFVNECLASTHLVTDQQQMKTLDESGACTFMGVQILFHERLATEIRTIHQ